MALALALSGLTGLLIGYLAASTRVDAESARRFTEGLERGRALAEMGPELDQGPVQLAAALRPLPIRRWRRRPTDWKESYGRAELHETLQQVGVGL